VVEWLENRRLLSTVVVNTTDDVTHSSGTVVSLRDALNLANAATTPTTITFDSTVFANYQTITLSGTELVAGGSAAAETIIGPSAGVAISGAGTSRVMMIDPNGVVGMTNISIIDGASGTDSGGVGGGIYNQGTLNMTDCSVWGNTATGDGGGIDSSLNLSNGSTLNLTNVTLSGNTAGATEGNGGGGLRILGQATLRDVTIDNNVASGTSGGGISIGTGAGPVSIGNSIVAGNLLTAAGPDVAGPVVSVGYNFIGESDQSSGWIGTDILGTIASPINPDLGALTNNGGPSQTMEPQTGSPVIDQGSNALIPGGITTDQRGLPRIYNGTVDIGAVETQPQIIVAAPANESTSPHWNRNFSLGSFTESTTTGPYSITVNWGDGTAHTTFQQAAAGAINQFHTYTTVATDTVTVTVEDSTGAISGSAQFSMTVLSAQLTVTPPAAQAAVAGRVTTPTLGSFSATGSTAPYTVTVNWGDGTASNIFTVGTVGTITPQTHIFPTSGTFTVNILVTDATGNVGNTASFTENVSPVNIVLTSPGAESAFINTPKAFALGSFTTSNTTGPYQVSVAWGDGSAVVPVNNVSAGTIAAETHTFSAVGVYTATVVVYDSTLTIEGYTTFLITVTTGSTASTTTLASSATNFQAGQSVTLTATVSPSAATGVVNFLDSGSVLGTANVSGGVATYTTNQLSNGTYVVTANYTGDPTYAASISQPVDLFVSAPPVSTTLTLSSTLTNPTTSQAITLTAVLNPSSTSAGTATGTVIFYRGSVELGTGVVQPGGYAQLTTTGPLPLGTNLMTASYSGDTNFAASVAIAVPVTVTASGTQVVLSSNVHSKTVAQFVTFSASVEPEFDTPSTFTQLHPTGTVSFSEDGVAFGSAPVASDGIATLTTNDLPVGLDLLTATYSGDSLFAAAIPGSEDLTVTAHALVPTLKSLSAPSSVVAGNPVRGSARVVLTNGLSNFEQTTELGYFGVRVFASPSTTLDPTVDPVLGYVVRKARILLNHQVTVVVPFTKLPRSLAAGTYHLLLQSTDAAGNTEEIDTGSTINVIAPVISLSGSFVNFSSAALTHGATLTVTNSGNFDDVTHLTAVVGFASDAAGQNILASGTGTVTPKVITIRAGRSTRVRVTGWQNVVFAALPSTFYYTVTLTDQLGDTMTAVSPLQG
jgi:hypothetical protein